ncbi:neuroglian-like isoform X1 [Poecilia latipinna]|uniref:neuroglian-like isoform X1 n=1 Tax=Poecilia latipinna TaxID=48699 RepID=UPI00072D9D6A|nr:PREDICTED: neuroglian-like isoform X1 [Poecilia latipinna]
MQGFSRHEKMLLHVCFMVSAFCGGFPAATAEFSLQQPAVVAGPLGQDVLLPCQLLDSQHEKLLNQPVLYWEVDGKQLPFNENKTSSSFNKSIELKEVRWSDGGTYECKLSMRTDRRGSFRLKGNKTTLIVHDTMTFNLSSHHDSLLRCEVTVSQDPGLTLTLTRNGCVVQSSAPSERRAANGTITLSATVHLSGNGQYGCQLRLQDVLITSSSFHSQQAGRYQLQDERRRYSEPWLLYAGLLLVPALVLLAVVAAMLMCR